MTETLSHVALRRLNGPDASAWYSPFPGVGLDVNADGCLVIDAPAVHAGRLVTRDIAELREDGRFRILGRRDNTICSGGVKIQLEDVEARLRPSLHVPFVATAVGDAKYGEVLGMHIIGPRATDLIAEGALAIGGEMTLDEIIATIHSHPTVTETMRECALDALGRAVHIPPRKKK